jgi:PAS domain S-box-containing protein
MTQPYSIRKRLIRINTLVTFIVILIVQTLCVLYGLTQYKSLVEKQVQTIATIVGSTASGGLAFTSESALKDALELAHYDERLVQVDLFDTENNLIISYNNPKSDDPLLASNPNSKLDPYMLYRFSVPVTYFGVELGRIAVTASLYSLYRSFFKIWAILIALLLPALLGAYLLAVYSEQMVRRPLNQLATAISSIDLENSAQAKTPSTAVQEFQQLTSSFGEMLVALQQRDSILKEHQQLLQREVEQRTHELRESEERFRVIVEESQDWIWEADTEGHLLYSNNQIEKLTGMSVGSLLNKSLFAIMAAEDIAATRFMFAEHARRKDGWKRSIIRYEHTDGTRRTVESSAAPVFDSTGQVTGFRGVDRDITERLELEHAIRQKERLASLGTFVAGIAHEINNPIGSARLAVEYAQLFKDSPDGDQVVDKALNDVLLECDRCSDITRGVLTFAGAGSLQMSPCDITGILDAVTERLAPLLNPPDTQLTLTLEENLPQIMGDKLALEQVFLNLVMNCSQANATRIKITACHEDGQLVLLVTDNGDGIPENMKKMVFDPFFTSRREVGGAGMGLSICHGFINEHMGSIEIQRTDETGTAFRVILPVVSPSQSQEASYA